MTAVGFGMDALLGLLLLAALAVGLRLNGRLRGLRDGQASFVRAVGDLDAAAMRAEAGLSALRSATVEAHDHLLDRIDAARALAVRLEAGVEAAAAACSRLEHAVAEAPVALRVVPPPASPNASRPPPPPGRIDPLAPRIASPPFVAHAQVEDAAGALARFVARRGARVTAGSR